MDFENNRYLFIDGSVNPQLKIGFGAYLLLDEYSSYCTIKKEEIKTRMFEDTSSTKLELQVLIYALNDINSKQYHLTIYTDCQNILTLNGRRETLEKNNYLTKTGKTVKNSKEYKEFFKLIDTYNCDFIKLKGHKKKSTKDDIDKIFSIVDKTARIRLREYIKSKS
ncbi:MAG: RNase H family protein [Campylobacterota bacterium]|nr:RNase H family protein [Campylobacterota bacterium]